VVELSAQRLSTTSKAYSGSLSRPMSTASYRCSSIRGRSSRSVGKEGYSRTVVPWKPARALTTSLRRRSSGSMSAVDNTAPPGASEIETATGIAHAASICLLRRQPLPATGGASAALLKKTRTPRDGLFQSSESFHAPENGIARRWGPGFTAPVDLLRLARSRTALTTGRVRS